MNQSDVILDVEYKGTVSRRVYVETSDDAIIQAMSDPAAGGLVIKSMTHSVSYITKL